MCGSHSPIRPVSTTACHCAPSLAEIAFKKLQFNYDLLTRVNQGRFDRWLSAHTSGRVPGMRAADSWLASMRVETMLDEFETLLGEIFWIKYRNENEETLYTNRPL